MSDRNTVSGTFSRKVKEEIKENIGKARHCQLAELAVIISFYGRISIKGGKPELGIQSEHEYIHEKFNSLIKKAFGIDELTTDDVMRVLAAVKIWNENENMFMDPKIINPVLLQQSCCRRAFIRGAFLSAGSMSDPNKSYHLEIVCSEERQASQVKEVINSFDMDAKIVTRKKNYVVYMKEGEHIVDLMNIMGAYKALMDLENVRIMKEMRNSVNRKVNCETANIGKTVNAAVRQISAITYIRDNYGLDSLPEQLGEMAEVRLENPDTPLKDLGALLDPPIGKSGVNHRLRKLVEMAEEMGMNSQ
ncbi:MAG: DNA-binding protein WhiA [Lachnospiraceae bacterium]|nr:DNA-binding protein WhiA [Lachnospiraceae bacterium]